MEKSTAIVKHLHKSVYTEVTLYSRDMKLLTLVYTTLNVAFLNKLKANLSFSVQILTLRNEKELCFSVSNEKLMFLFFVYTLNKEW